MFSRLKIKSFAQGIVERARNLPGLLLALWNVINFTIGGVFHVHCYGPDGVLKWTATAKNGVTDVGIASLLNTYFRGTSPITTWYISLINQAGYTALAASDTMSSHAGWAEVGTGDYSDTNRVEWSPGAPSSGAIVNGTSSDFHMTPVSALTVKGLFLVSDNTKGGTAGVLFATALFTGGNQVVNNGDTLKVTYTVSAASN